MKPRTVALLVIAAGCVTPRDATGPDPSIEADYFVESTPAVSYTHLTLPTKA